MSGRSSAARRKRVERVPISFILDDGGPVNGMRLHDPQFPHKLVVPNDLWLEFGDFCREHDVKGKFTVLPCPAGLGRIDKGLWPLPVGHLERFLGIMRNDIAPQFDITPELVTHSLVMNMRSNTMGHFAEDEWVAMHNRRDIADYIAFALRILKRVGLRANGVTSPWSTGNRNERTYAAAISDAVWRVNRIAHTWYFLPIDTKSLCARPKVTYRSRKYDRSVVSVTSHCSDFAWHSQYCRSRRAGVAKAREAMEWVLSRDGKRGRMRDLFEAKCPIVFHSHLSSLYSNGTRAGLKVFEELVGRIERAFGDDIRWVKCSELARMYR